MFIFLGKLREKRLNLTADVEKYFDSTIYNNILHKKMF